MGLFKTKSPTQAQINQADALLETELTIDLQLRMNATCSKICNDTIHERKSVDDKKENEKYLNQAEQRCLDVCTWKYMTAQKSTLAYVNEEIKNNMSAKGLNMEEEVRKHAKAMGKVEQNLVRKWRKFA